MVQGQIWEVVCSSGLIVRIGRSVGTPPQEQALSGGSLVQEVERVGDQLRFNRIAGTGHGPNSGWVSIRTKDQDLIVPSDWTPPKQGWTILSEELPAVEAMASLAPASAGAKPLSGPGSIVAPQCPQTAGRPYMFYRQINFLDTKPTGLRMSSCLAAMDDCRTDLFTICDQTVESMRKVTDPFVEAVIELRPEILKLGQGDTAAGDGLLYSQKGSSGAVLSWLRCEATFGWPLFPMRNEEQTLYLLGKQKHANKAAPIARARFTECLLDESKTPPVLLSGQKWEEDVDRFFARVKSEHSMQALDMRPLHKLYPTSGNPFVPTTFKIVSWMMSHSFGDLWGVLYHAKAPELLWDLNKLASGSFAKLVGKEPDPQAIAMTLPKKMSVGVMYDALCFLDEDTKKAVYILVPTGAIGSSEVQKECVLGVFANYDWASAPADGQSIRAEDMEVLGAPSRNSMIDFAAEKETKVTRLLDLSKVQR